MDRDDFIITVYCLVCDQYRALFSEQPLRHGGFTPQLTDEEVITLEICGEYFKLNADKDLFNYLPLSLAAGQGGRCVGTIIKPGFRVCVTGACSCAKPPICGRRRRPFNSGSL